MTDKMTNQEAIDRLKLIRSPYMEVAVDMAIEALKEPKTIIGIDISYGSDKGIATLFKGKDDKLTLEEVKEIMAVVRCKDCRHTSECHKSVQYTRNELNTTTIGYSPIEWCSRGERKEP